MKIEFTVDELYDVIDEYEPIFEQFESRFTKTIDGSCFAVRPYRVVIPDLHCSLRLGDWYAKSDYEDCDDEDYEDDCCDDEDGGRAGFVYQDGANILYDENQKNINKYNEFSTGSLSYFLHFVAKRHSMEYSPDMPCYIDTAELMGDHRMARRFPEVKELLNITDADLTIPDDVPRHQYLYHEYLREERLLSVTSVKRYNQALAWITKYLQKKGLISGSIYEITEVSKLEEINECLKADQEFLEMNNRGHQMYSAGMNNYVRFARNEEFF